MPSLSPTMTQARGGAARRRGGLQRQAAGGNPSPVAPDIAASAPLRLGARRRTRPPPRARAQGNIAAWRKREGASIAPGDVLAEVETDKATIEWEAQEEGFLAKILMGDGARGRRCIAAQALARGPRGAARPPAARRARPPRRRAPRAAAAPAAGSKDIPVGTAVAVLVEEERDVAAFADYTGGGGGAPAAPKQQPAAAAPAAAAAAAPPPRGGASFPPHEVLTMPALSPTMEMGNILDWRKAAGDAVAAGDILCEVETDKATMAWEAQEDGFVAAILLPSGSKDVPVGTPAAVIVEDQAAVAQFEGFTAADAAGGAAAAPAPAASAPPPPRPAAAAAAPAAGAPKAPATPSRAAAGGGGRVVASPYARKLAADAGVSLAGVAGSGEGGRVTAEDVQQLIAGGGAAPAGGGGGGGGGVAAAYAGAAAPGGEWTDEAVAQVKRITAARLLESKQTIPHYYLSIECQLDALLALRAQVNKQLGEAGVKLSVNDFVVKAAALALRKVRRRPLWRAPSCAC